MQEPDIITSDVPWSDVNDMVGLFDDWEPTFDLLDLPSLGPSSDFSSQFPTTDFCGDDYLNTIFPWNDSVLEPHNWAFPNLESSQTQAPGSLHTTTTLETDESSKYSHQETTSNKPPDNETCKHESKSKKRSWEESLIVFPANKNANPDHRRRKAFTPCRKQEVALNRIIGACIECKLLKVSCNYGIPCTQCIKRTKCPNLAQSLCIRRSLKATRFDNIDLFRITRLESVLLDLCISKPRGPKRDAYITYKDSDVHIKVQVQDFERFDVPAVDGVLHPASSVQSLIGYGYNHYSISEIPNRPCRIVEESFPTLEALIQCFPRSRLGGTMGPFAGLHQAFIRFAELYTKNRSTLPLKEFMDKTLQMKLLLSTFRETAYIRELRDSAHSSFLPQAMALPIRLLKAKAIVDLELQILSGFDRLLNKSDGLGRQNPLATWVCLWILILSYKEHMQYISAMYMHLVQIKQTLYGLAKHIYDTLTAIYAALFKTTSPLTLDWRTDEIAEMLGRDQDLIKALCAIKTEMFWFHSAKGMLFAEDALFRTLVVENESKLLASHIRAAKRQGIL